MHQFRLRWSLIAGLTMAVYVSRATPLPVVTLNGDDLVITQSCVVVIAGLAGDKNQNGTVQIKADNVTVQFQGGAVLRGAPAGTPWNQLRGIGIRVENQRNVTLKNLQVHGFKN